LPSIREELTLMNRTCKIAFAAAAAGALVAGVDAAALAQSPTASSPHAVEAAVTSAAIPPALAVPSGQRLVSVFTVERGSQVYTCAKGAFTLLEPDALLRSGDQLALHTRGPQWISTNDGSAVTGAAIATVPVPGAVPELLLKATANRGAGLFGHVDFIQRLQTRGGVAPAGTCTNGSQKAVTYSAQYRFYAPAPSSATQQR
jgi:hypothetical protein